MRSHGRSGRSLLPLSGPRDNLSSCLLRYPPLNASTLTPSAQSSHSPSWQNAFGWISSTRTPRPEEAMRSVISSDSFAGYKLSACLTRSAARRCIDEHNSSQQEHWPSWVTHDGSAPCYARSPSAGSTAMMCGSMRSGKSTECLAEAPARAASSCAMTARLRVPSCRLAMPSPACSSPSSRAQRMRSSRTSSRAFDAAQTCAADVCFRIERRTDADAGATWPHAAIARRRLATG